MKRPGITVNSLLMVVMLLTSLAAWALKPTRLLADALSPLKLSEIVPTAFGGWRELQISQGQIIDPSQQTLLNKIYSETLSRSYVNDAGYVIMLSIAYGRDQRESLALHQPELCYPAQGFTLLNKRFATLDSNDRHMAITRIDTRLNRRRESVTYWTMIGEKIYQGSINKRLQEFQYGFKNLIADGMLVRMSSIDDDTQRAYAMQASFANAMIADLPRGFVNRFAGATGNGG
jgi:EpsI family protein